MTVGEGGVPGPPAVATANCRVCGIGSTESPARTVRWIRGDGRFPPAIGMRDQRLGHAAVGSACPLRGVGASSGAGSGRHISPRPRRLPVVGPVAERRSCRSTTVPKKPIVAVAPVIPIVPPHANWMPRAGRTTATADRSLAPARGRGPRAALRIDAPVGGGVGAGRPAALWDRRGALLAAKQRRGRQARARAGWNGGGSDRPQDA